MSGSPRRVAPERLVVAAGLAAVVALLFAEAIVGRAVFFHRDTYWVWYPRIESTVRAVLGGAWPVWNPRESFGLPSLADASYEIAYPPTWLNLVLSPTAYYTVFVVVHLFAAGFGASRLGRAWGLSGAGSFLAGAAWASSGPLLSFTSLYHHFAGAAWVPWVLVALEGALRRRTPGSACVLGAAAAGQVLAGSADMCLVSGVVAAGRAAVAIWDAPGVTRRETIAAVARAAAVSLATTLGLSAAQWIPSMGVLSSGARLALTPYAKTFWSMHPWTLADLVVPGGWSDLRVSDAVRARLFESREPFVASLYVGAASLGLAILGAAQGDGMARRMGRAFAAFFLVCALGRFTPVYPLLSALPPFSIIRYPVKFAVPFSLFWALLVGAGFDAWRLEPRARRRAFVAAATAGALALLALAGSWLLSRHGASWIRGLLEPDASWEEARGALRTAALLSAAAVSLFLWRARRPASSPALSVLVAALVLGDLVAHGRDVGGLAPEALAHYRPPLVSYFQEKGELPRLYVATRPPVSALAISKPPDGWSSEWWWTIGIEESLQAPIGTRWGLDGSYDGDLTGLTPRAVSEFTVAVAMTLERPAGLRLLQLGGVDYVVSLQALPAFGAPVHEAATVFALPVRLYRVPETLPKIYLVGRVRTAPEAEVARVVLSPAFDPRHEVALAGAEGAWGDPRLEGTARILWRRDDALAIETTADAPGHLVVLESFDPAWRATVDGRATPIVRANALFRGVAVPAGRHVVEMRYRPPAVVAGVLVSVLFLAAGLAAALAHARASAARATAAAPAR